MLKKKVMGTANRIATTALIAAIASTVTGIRTGYAEARTEIIFGSKKSCEEVAPLYNKTVSSGTLTSYCLASDLTNSYSYPQVIETWEYKCRKTSTTTCQLSVSKYDKNEYAVAKPPTTWTSLRQEAKGALKSCI